MRIRRAWIEARPTNDLCRCVRNLSAPVPINQLSQGDHFFRLAGFWLRAQVRSWPVWAERVDLLAIVVR